MRILYHHRTQAKDGSIVHIEELVNALRALGHEVIVVGPSAAEGSGEGRSRLIGLLREALPQALYELLECLYAARAFIRLRQACRKHRPDVLYERYNLFQPAGVWLSRIHRLPMLLEVNAPLVLERSTHGALSLAGLARWTERFAWRSADFVLPVTHALADHVRATGVPDDRIVVIPNGINPRTFAAEDTAAAKCRLGLPETRLVLGFTGYVREWHGLDQVVDLLADPSLGGDAHLLLVGDGPARAQLEAQAKRLGVADRLTITGLVDRHSVGGYVSAFDIALQPAVTAYASPLKLFEYMYLGRAIVAPDAPNIREVLVDGDNAILFDPAQPEEIRAAILRLFRDDALRHRIGTNARKTIVEHGYTWGNNAIRVVDLFDQLLRSTAGTLKCRAGGLAEDGHQLATAEPVVSTQRRRANNNSMD